MKTTPQLSKLEKILELAKKSGASEAEVIQKNYMQNPVSFENNKLKSLESNESSGIAIRLIKNKKIGIASSTDPDALETIVSSAIEASEFGPEATFELTKEKLNLEKVSATKPELPLENLVERGTNTIESLKAFHKDLLISGGFDLSTGKTVYLNTKNVFGERSKSVFSTGFYAHLVRGEDFLGIYESKDDLDNFPDENKIKNTILQKLNFSKDMVQINTKKYPVIFSPSAVLSVFISILAVVLNGKVIQQGISPLVGMLGKELFDSKLNFTEDPMSGTKKAPFDDEGIKTQKKELIKNGVINSFYFDLSSGSRRRGLQSSPSTGNGFKSSLSSAPSPSLTNISVQSGKNLKYDEMIKNMKEGILIEQVLGAGQSNTLAGEFNVGIELGFKIENGKIKGRIKNCMVAGNIFEILKNINEISSDQEQVHGSSLLPAFLIDNLTVGAKQ